MTRASPRGQSTVEFALVLPVLLITALLVVQVALVAYAQLAVVHVAREVARAVAVDPDADVAEVVARTSPIGAKDLVVEVHLEVGESDGRSMIRVSARHQSSPILEMFGAFSEHITVRAETVMLSEP